MSSSKPSTEVTPPPEDASQARAPSELLRMTPARAVWAVSWPMIALGLLKTSYFLIDSWFVGRLGPAALEAIGGAAFSWWMIHIACELAGVGTQALVSRHEGAGRRDLIPRAITQGLYVSAAMSVLLLALAPSAGLYFELLGFSSTDAARPLGEVFLTVSLGTAATTAVHSLLGSCFRALGDTRTALAIAAITLVANALLDPLLIWGLPGVPGLGIAGAAWATALANGVGAVVGLAVLSKRGLAPILDPPRLQRIGLIARIGTPITIAGISFSLVYVALGRIINGYGTHHMAALGIGHRLESLAYMVTVGFSVGAASMVGQSLGAGWPQRAAQSARAAWWMCAAVLAPATVILMLGAPWFFGLFTDDPAIVASGTSYLRIQALVFLFMGLDVVYEGAFSGAGNTLPPLVISAVFTTARIPLAWLLGGPLGLGIDGVWVAIAATTAVRGAVAALWWRRGRWATALRNDEVAG